MNLNVTEKFQLPQMELAGFILFTLIPIVFSFFLFRKERRAVLAFSIILTWVMSYAGILVAYVLLRIYGSNTMSWQERIKFLIESKGLDENGEVAYKDKQGVADTQDEKSLSLRK